MALFDPPPAPAFDTLAVNENLRKDDVFNEAQASKLVSAIRDATDSFVTKSDLELRLSRQTWRLLIGVGLLLGIFRWLLPE